MPLHDHALLLWVACSIAKLCAESEGETEEREYTLDFYSCLFYCSMGGLTSDGTRARIAASVHLQMLLVRCPLMYSRPHRSVAALAWLHKTVG
ncbi:hypothetical protein F5883DRAFT_544956, partial [Diaporthe sp. PMI_573]